MQKSVVVLSFILFLVVVFTGVMSTFQELKSEKKKSATYSTTMSLRPYWYNQEMDISAVEPPRHYTMDDFLRRGREIRSRGNHREAEDIFKTALLFDPENAETTKEIGELVYMDGRFDEACNYFKQYLMLKPDLVESYTNLAISLIRANNLTTAETIARKGLSQFGNDEPGPFYLILACVNHKMGDDEQAEYFLSKAYEILGPTILKLLKSQWASSLKELNGYNQIHRALGGYQNKLNSAQGIKSELTIEK